MTEPVAGREGGGAALAPVRTEAGTWPREILVLTRDPGYLRVHVPPLLYAPALGIQLQRALIALRGVRRVSVDRPAARLSVHYDPALADDRAALRLIDKLGSPLVDRMAPDAFTTALVEQREVRRTEQAERAARLVYLGLLVWVHLWVFRSALRRPVRMWWFWALLGFGVWTHRRPIRASGLPGLTGST